MDEACVVLCLCVAAQNGRLLRVGISHAEVQKTLRGLVTPLPIEVLAAL